MSIEQDEPIEKPGALDAVEEALEELRTFVAKGITDKHSRSRVWRIVGDVWGPKSQRRFAIVKERFRAEVCSGNTSEAWRRALKWVIEHVEEGVSPSDAPFDGDRDPETMVAQDLAKAAEGKNAPMEDCIEWVSRNLLTEWDDIEIDSVPDPVAVSLLRWAKDHERDFRKNYEAPLARSRMKSPPAPAAPETVADEVVVIEQEEQVEQEADASAQATVDWEEFKKARKPPEFPPQANMVNMVVDEETGTVRTDVSRGTEDRAN